MSEKETFEAFCEKLDVKYDKMKASLMWIIGIIITTFLGFGGVQILTFGQIKHQVEINTEKLDFVERDYVPAWFLEGMIQNMNYQTEEIVASLNGDNKKVKEINTKYIEFQKTMLNNLIKYRGGMTYTTRGGTQSQPGSL